MSANIPTASLIVVGPNSVVVDIEGDLSVGNGRQRMVCDLKSIIKFAANRGAGKIAYRADGRSQLGAIMTNTKGMKIC